MLNTLEAHYKGREKRTMRDSENTWSKFTIAYRACAVRFPRYTPREQKEIREIMK